MDSLKVFIGRNGDYYNYTNLREKIVWSGRKGAAPRTVTITFADSESYGLDRVAADVGAGQKIQIFEPYNEIFRGLVMTGTSDNSRRLTLKCYDNLVYMTNNKASFSYKKKRADEIFADCCSKLGLSIGGTVNTEKVISEIAKTTTFWDVIQEALSQTYKSTGRRYYVCSEKGLVYLRRREMPNSFFPLNIRKNTVSYERTRSIYDTRTRLRVVTSKNKEKKFWQNADLENRIGVFQDVKSVDKDITRTELDQLVAEFQQEKAVVGDSMTWEGPGDSSVRAGGVVYISNDHLNLRRIAYVDEDTHTWQNGTHTMKLKLNFASGIDAAG